jgi:hypothetical protein
MIGYTSNGLSEVPLRFDCRGEIAVTHVATWRDRTLSATGN